MLAADITQLNGPIVVFGASGFIGTNLFEQLLRVRQNVFAITHDATKAWRLKLLDVPVENVVHCDMLSNTSVRDVLVRIKPKTIFNLAAYRAYSKQKNAALTYETTVLGMVNILETCTPDMVYIHAGSSSEFGFNCTAPKETDRVEPNSHYAVSKISAAFTLAHYASVHQLNTLNLRLSSIYGTTVHGTFKQVVCSPNARGTVVALGPVAANVLVAIQKEALAGQFDVYTVTNLPLALPTTLAHGWAGKPLLVVEEHVSVGGLAQQLSVKLLSMGVVPSQFVSLSAQGYPNGLYGDQAYHQRVSDLDPTSIARQLTAFLE